MSAPSLNSRNLAEKVRAKLLKKCNDILDGNDEDAKKELLMKMCTTLLPRLAELTGEGGKAVTFKWEYGETKNIDNTISSKKLGGEAPPIESKMEGLYFT